MGNAAENAAVIRGLETVVLGRGLAHELKQSLRCPHRGQVPWSALPYEEAQRLISRANVERTKRRGLDKPSPISEAEIILLSGLLFYGESPLLQHPVGPYDLDFYIADYNAAIEVDGREWHDVGQDIKRDRRVLEIAGIHTYRISAKDACRDPLWACRRLCKKIIQDRRQRQQEQPCPTS